MDDICRDSMISATSAKSPAKASGSRVRGILGLILMIVMALVIWTGMNSLMRVIAGEHGGGLHHPLGWLALGLMVVHIALNWRPLLCAGARVLGLRKASGAAFRRSVVDVALVLLLPLVIITSEMHHNIWWHVGAGTLMVGVLVWHIVLNGRALVRNVGRLFGAA